MKINHLDAFSDNYIWTMEFEGKLAIVDPGDAKPVHEYINKTGYVLTDVLITHHHGIILEVSKKLSLNMDVQLMALQEGTLKA